MSPSNTRRIVVSDEFDDDCLSSISVKRRPSQCSLLLMSMSMLSSISSRSSIGSADPPLPPKSVQLCTVHTGSEALCGAVHKNVPPHWCWTGCAIAHKQEEMRRLVPKFQWRRKFWSSHYGRCRWCALCAQWCVSAQAPDPLGGWAGRAMTWQGSWEAERKMCLQEPWQENESGMKLKNFTFICAKVWPRLHHLKTVTVLDTPTKSQNILPAKNPESFYQFLSKWRDALLPLLLLLLSNIK